MSAPRPAPHTAERPGGTNQLIESFGEFGGHFILQSPSILKDRAYGREIRFPAGKRSGCGGRGELVASIGHARIRGRTARRLPTHFQPRTPE
jgi:hypothetical protein